MKKITKILLSVGFVIMSTSQLFAEEFYVSASGDNSNGSTLARAYTSFTRAYNRSKQNTEDDIIIVDGTVDIAGVSLTINDLSGFKITFISADLGYGGTQGVITNSDPNTGMFGTNENSANSDTEFIGIQFSDVSSNFGRGAVLNINVATTMSFTDCVFKNNITTPSSTSNGVIYVSDNSVSFTNCVFENNSCANGDGGIIRSSSNATLILDRCLFKNNSARLAVGNDGADGGALVIEGAATITNTTFYKNSASNRGGAVFISGTTNNVTMTNVSAFENFIEGASNGPKGGFVRIQGTGTYTFNNVFFANNIASEADETTITDIGSARTSTANIVVNNSLITRFNGNDSALISTASQIKISGQPLDVSDSGIYFDDSEGLVKFNTVSDSSFSPIDLGDASFLTEFVDQNGNTRPNTGAVDAGAWESGQTLSLTTLFDSSDEIVGFYSTTNGNKIVIKNSAKAELYNFLGAKIDVFQVNEEYEILNSKYSSGIYILKIEIEGKAYAKKFIVQ